MRGWGSLFCVCDGRNLCMIINGKMRLGKDKGENDIINGGGGGIKSIYEWEYFEYEFFFLWVIFFVYNFKY